MVGPSSAASSSRRRSSSDIRPWSSVSTRCAVLARARSSAGRRRASRAVPRPRRRERSARPGARVTHVPPRSASTWCRACGQARDVGLGAAGREPDGGVRGEPQQVEHPPAGQVLGGDDARGHRGQPRVLFPRRHQPVRAERGRGRAADDEAEEPAGAGRGEPGADGRDQRVDHLGAPRGPSGRSVPSDSSTSGTPASAGDRTDGQGGEIALGMRVRGSQRVGDLAGPEAMERSWHDRRPRGSACHEAPRMDVRPPGPSPRRGDGRARRR